MDEQVTNAALRMIPSGRHGLTGALERIANTLRCAPTGPDQGQQGQVVVVGCHQAQPDGYAKGSGLSSKNPGDKVCYGG